MGKLTIKSHYSHVAHIKAELHRLREEAPTQLSAPRRAELGLDVWPTAIREAGKLQFEDSRTSELLQETLRDQAGAGEFTPLSLLGEADSFFRTERSHSASIDEHMRRKILHTALADLETTISQQQAHISALTAVIDEWTAEFCSKLERVRLNAK